MFRLIRQVFIELWSSSESLANVINVSDYTNHNLWLYNNQPCISRPTLIDLNIDEHKQGFCYNSFMINLGRCNGSCNTLDNSSGRIYVPNEIENPNLSVFNMITKINE